MDFELTEQQKLALKRTKEWWTNRTKNVWEISGAAGTGKTTIVYHVVDEIGLSHDDVLFMAEKEILRRQFTALYMISKKYLN